MLRDISLTIIPVADTFHNVRPTDYLIPMTTDTKPKPKTFSELSATSQVGIISMLAMIICLIGSLGLLGAGISSAVIFISCVIGEAAEDLTKAKGGV